MAVNVLIKAVLHKPKDSRTFQKPIFLSEAGFVSRWASALESVRFVLRSRNKFAAVSWYPPLTVCRPVTQNTKHKVRLSNTKNIFQTVRTNNVNFEQQWKNSWQLDQRKHRTHLHLLPFLNSHHHAQNTNNAKVRYAQVCIKTYFSCRAVAQRKTRASSFLRFPDHTHWTRHSR